MAKATSKNVKKSNNAKKEDNKPILKKSDLINARSKLLHATPNNKQRVNYRLRADIAKHKTVKRDELVTGSKNLKRAQPDTKDATK